MGVALAGKSGDCTTRQQEAKEHGDYNHSHRVVDPGDVEAAAVVVSDLSQGGRVGDQWELGWPGLAISNKHVLTQNSIISPFFAHIHFQLFKNSKAFQQSAGS